MRIDKYTYAMRKEYMAGAYVAGSDAIMKYFVSPQSFLGPYLIHSLNPLAAGVAGCLISLTAEKCYRYVKEKWLSESLQDSSEAQLLTWIFCHIVVGSAFGVGSSLFIPTAGITVATGVALSIAALIGNGIAFELWDFYKCPNRQILDIRQKAIAKNIDPNKAENTHRQVDNILNGGIYTVFSNAVTKCFVDPQSLLGHYLIHNLKNPVGINVLGFFIAFLAEIFYEGLTEKECFKGPILTSYIAKSLIRLTLNIGTGVVLGSCCSLTIATGIASGASAFVGATLSRYLRKIIEEASLNVLLRDLNEELPVMEDEIMYLLEKITNERKASDQAKLCRRYLKGPLKVNKLSIRSKFIETLLSLLAKENIQKMTLEEFNTWKSKNKSFWNCVLNGDTSIKLNSLNASKENLAGLYYAMTETDFLLETLGYCPVKIYPYLSENLKKDEDFNFKSVVNLGWSFWEIMDDSLKTEDFVYKLLTEWNLELKDLRVDPRSLSRSGRGKFIRFLLSDIDNQWTLSECIEKSSWFKGVFRYIKKKNCSCSPKTRKIERKTLGVSIAF
jgi:hypothetical protein